MDKICVMMVDYRIEGFKRYANEIASELKKRSPMTIVGVYINPSDSSSISYSSIDELIDASKYHYNAEKLIDRYCPDIIIVFAHRVFDYLFTIDAHRKGIPVINFQHGLYMEHTVISSISRKSLRGLINQKWKKTVQYSSCLRKLTGFNIAKHIKILVMLIKGKNLYCVMNQNFKEHCNADISYVYGNYWIEFYKKTYLETQSEYKIVGYPELEKEFSPIDKSVFDQDLPTLCYLAQSSVEDGVINEEVMTNFYSRLAASISGYNLIIKFHPRSEKKLYAPLLDEKLKGQVYSWEEQNLPRAEMYIGHDSAVVARALSLTSKTLVYRLVESQPSVFEKYTCYCVDEKGDLRKEIRRMEREESSVNEQELESFVFYNKEGAIRTTVDDIAIHYLKEKIT